MIDKRQGICLSYCMILKVIIKGDEIFNFYFISNERILSVAELYRETCAILSFQYQVTDEIDFILIINIRFP